jgi:siroheme synthase-like protein
VTYYPVFLDLHHRRAVVVGGGRVAERKVRTLLKCGANVRVVSPSLTVGLSSLARRGAIQYRKQSYRATDLAGASLVIAATHDPAVQEAVARGAKKRRLWVNVVDRTDLCSFIAPSILTRGDLVIAISTGGSSPALARRLRRDLAKGIGRAYGEFLSLAGRIRTPILRQIPSPGRRRRLFHRIMNSGLLKWLQQGRRKEALRMLQALLEREGVSIQLRKPNHPRRSVQRRQSS